MPDEVGIVIDGFPRDVAQALSFEDQVRLSPYILNDFFFFLLKSLILKIYTFLERLAVIWNEFGLKMHKYINLGWQKVISLAQVLKN